MLLMSKIAPDVKTQDKKDLDNLFGFEYSGITINSRRIVGVNRNRCLSNFCQLDETFSWTVPESWSLEDAATLLYVYCTCIFALYINVEMKKGDKILIHTGSDDIGQTAINLVLWAVKYLLQLLHQKNFL
ncbi:fatty acid synthase-like [Vespa velutina]|uniref:fatty acid synthase-like n=1 Tax=Vespa velutina TaxID=202808 RepID=UPI001FB284B5|nr:fatty acid synthase-like [Vespa velutina]